MSDQYSAERLESACAKALFYTPRPSYKNIQSILKSRQDVLENDRKDMPSSNNSESGFTRGADYNGRRDK